MSYTYDSATHTLTITGPAGYTEFLASGLPLDKILILKDTSQPRVESFIYEADGPTKIQYREEGVLIPGFEKDEPELRNDRTFQSYTPPADFPLLPNLFEAHFTGILLQPPRFPLPSTCKLYVCLEGRFRGDPPQHHHGDYWPYLIDPLDEVFPWFEMPGLTTLRLRNFRTSTTAPPPSKSLKHLFLMGSHSFTLPPGSKLPENLKTFVFSHETICIDSPHDDGYCGAGELFAALPRHSLETLILVPNSSNCCGGYNIPQSETLLDFIELTTLCVHRQLMNEDMELCHSLPDFIETLVVILPEYRDRGPRALWDDMQGVLYVDQGENLKKVVLVREHWSYDTADPEGDEMLKEFCRGFGIELTLAWELKGEPNWVSVEFPEELEEGRVHPHFRIEEYVSSHEQSSHDKLVFTFSKQPA